MAITLVLIYYEAYDKGFSFSHRKQTNLITSYRNIPLHALNILTQVTKLLKCRIENWFPDYCYRYFLILHHLFECVKIHMIACML